MALIKCPECGKEISDKAEDCIHCGHLLKKVAPNNEIYSFSEYTEGQINNAENVKINDKKSKRNKSIKIAIPLFALLCIALVFVSIYISNEADKNSENEINENIEEDWRPINDENDLKEGEMLITGDDGKKYAAKIDSDYYDKKKDSIYVNKSDVESSVVSQQKSEHKHIWREQIKTIHHNEEGHNERKEIKPAEELYVCNDCGKEFDEQSHYIFHFLCSVNGAEPCQGYNYSRKYIPAEYKEEWVVDKPEYDEKITEYVCSECGKIKDIFDQ